MTTPDTQLAPSPRGAGGDAAIVMIEGLTTVFRRESGPVRVVR